MPVESEFVEVFVANRNTGNERQQAGRYVILLNATL